MKTIDKKFTLRNNNEMPVIGLGTYRMTDPEVTKKAVTHALQFGYKLLDTAEVYRNHKILAAAIKDSKVNRKDLFITSKIWIHDYENVEAAYAKILKELETDYLDLLLIHWPLDERWFARSITAWKVLEKLYKEKKVRNIGVSNFTISQLEELKKHSEITPFVNQLELHPGLPLLELDEYCKKEGIVLTSWQTIMQGDVNKIPEIMKIADKYKVDGAAVALKWALQRGIAVIPKSDTPSRIESNVASLDKFELTNDEITTINAIKGKRTGPDPTKFSLDNAMAWNANVFKLRNEKTMPAVGFGTYLMTDEKITKAAIHHALNFGYKLIDTAELYQNHKIIAKVLKEKDVDRNNIFITTKIWPVHYKNVEASYNQFLNELGVTTIDLILLHLPISDSEDVVVAWKGLEKLYKEGKVANIGVSNFSIANLEKLKITAEVMPFVNQVELHPGLPLLELDEYCKKEGIVLTSWQTIMKGRVGEIPLIKELADKYNVDGAAVALKWALQRGIAVIPKSDTPSRIESNAYFLNRFELTNEEMKAINNLKGERLGQDPNTFTLAMVENYWTRIASK